MGPRRLPSQPSPPFHSLPQAPKGLLTPAVPSGTFPPLTPSPAVQHLPRPGPVVFRLVQVSTALRPYHSGANQISAGHFFPPAIPFPCLTANPSTVRLVESTSQYRIWYCFIDLSHRRHHLLNIVALDGNLPIITPRCTHLPTDLIATLFGACPSSPTQLASIGPPSRRETRKQ